MKLLENMPTAWPAPKLGEICEIIGGKAAPQIDAAFTEDEEGLPFVRMKDLGRHHFSNNLTDYSERIHPDYAKAHGYTTIPKGTILMPRSGSVGLNHRAILGRDSVIVSHICGLIIKNHEVDTGYLYRLLCRMDMRKICKKTTGLDSIAFSDLSKIRIPLPALEEQKRIATVLDAADALRVKRRQALARLDDLARALFLHHFGDPVSNPKGWPVRTLKSLGKVITGGTPSGKKEGMYGGPTPFITPGDLESFEPPKRTLTPEGAMEVDVVRTGATLVCCIGATIGKMMTATEPSAFNQQINAIEWGAEVDDGYGLAVLRLHRKRIAELGASTTLPILKKSSFEQLVIPVPPLDLQRRFAAEIAAVEMQKTRQRTQLAQLDTLFASLQDRAFSGKL